MCVHSVSIWTRNRKKCNFFSQVAYTFSIGYFDSKKVFAQQMPSVRKYVLVWYGWSIYTLNRKLLPEQKTREIDRTEMYTSIESERERKSDAFML